MISFLSQLIFQFISDILIKYWPKHVNIISVVSFRPSIILVVPFPPPPINTKSQIPNLLFPWRHQFHFFFPKVLPTKAPKISQIIYLPLGLLLLSLLLLLWWWWWWWWCWWTKVLLDRSNGCSERVGSRIYCNSRIAINHPENEIDAKPPYRRQQFGWKVAYLHFSCQLVKHLLSIYLFIYLWCFLIRR